METPEQRRARDARHEAAHAVAAVSFGHRFQFVTIVPKDEKRGYVQFPEEWSQNPTPEHAWEMAVIYLAPRLDAELHKLVVDDSSTLDMWYAEDIFQLTYPDVLDASLPRENAWHAARALVRRPDVQAAITTLAEALLYKGTIQAEEATEIVQAALRTHQPPSQQSEVLP